MSTSKNPMAGMLAVFAETCSAMADPEHCMHAGVAGAPREWWQGRRAEALKALADAGFDPYGDLAEPDPNEAEPSEHPVSICNGKGGLPLAKADAEILAGYLESHEPPSERLCELVEQFCNVLRGHKPSGPPRWHLHGEAGREP